MLLKVSIFRGQALYSTNLEAVRAWNMGSDTTDKQPSWKCTWQKYE